MSRLLRFIAVALPGVPLSLATAQEASPVPGPFTASVSGSVSWARVSEKACPPSEQLWGELMTESSATGTAPDVGEIHMESRHCAPAGDEITDGALTLVTADGVEIWMDYSGTAPFPSDTEIGDVLVFDGDFTVVGGTGPFENATGSGSFDGEITFEGLPDPEWPATWTFEGTIAY
jgi:hypothetical protein